MNFKEAQKLYSKIHEAWFDHKAERPTKGFNCHVWATAMHTVIDDPRLRLVHGHFSMNQHSWLEMDYYHRRKIRTGIVDIYSCNHSRTMVFNVADKAIGHLYNPRHTDYKINKTKVKQAIKYLQGEARE